MNQENKSKFQELLVSLGDKINNININSIKLKLTSLLEKRKEASRIKKEENEAIKTSETTIEDISKQRKGHIKSLLLKTLFIGFIIMLIMGAFILAFQNNEQEQRPVLDTKKVFNNTTSFGNIGEKDYFLEQNVLNEKLNKLWDESKKDKKSTEDLILEQTSEIKKNIGETIDGYKKEQDVILKDSLAKVKNEITENIDSKINKIEFNIAGIQDQITEIKNNPVEFKNGLSLNNGKIVFPDLDKAKNKKEEPVFKEVIEEEYVEEEIELNESNIIATNYATSSLEKNEEVKFKPFKLDLTKSLAKVTMLDGVKAPASIAGLKNPTPVLMILEDVVYTANDTETDLKGCFLSGAAVGNINTSRVEIFGTSLSCIIVADDGKKYKIEQTFDENKVWIKGEDGGNGVQGVIVDSSGKVLAQSAAIGFLQGISNYLQTTATTTQNVVTSDGNVAQVEALKNSFKVGAAQGMTSGFDLIIKKYEEILDGYFPYVDTKGGRTNLTVVFNGQIELEVTEYQDPNLQMLRENNLERGYRNE